MWVASIQLHIWQQMASAHATQHAWLNMGGAGFSLCHARRQTQLHCKQERIFHRHHDRNQSEFGNSCCSPRAPAAPSSPALKRLWYYATGSPSWSICKKIQRLRFSSFRFNFKLNILNHTLVQPLRRRFKFNQEVKFWIQWLYCMLMSTTTFILFLKIFF